MDRSKKSKVLTELERAVSEIGVPEHLFRIKKVPSMIQLEVVLGAHKHIISVRSGTSPADMRSQIDALTLAWKMRREGQIDLEEAVAAAGLQP